MVLKKSSRSREKKRGPGRKAEALRAKRQRKAKGAGLRAKKRGESDYETAHKVHGKKKSGKNTHRIKDVEAKSTMRSPQKTTDWGPSQ